MTFFNSDILARRRLGQGLHDRGEGFVFGAGSLSEDDRKSLAMHLPLHVKAVSLAEKIVPAGEVWDVSVRGEAWGLGDLVELYVVVNIGRLVLEPGAALAVRGNVFVLGCDRIEIQEPRGEWQIGILPTPFSVDRRGGPMRGTDGAEGASGAAGGGGRVPETEESFLGLSLRGNVEPGALSGEDGAPGEAGQRGGRGRNGGMCKLAELTFGDVLGEMTIFTQAGRGGDGGDGGTGGRGGDGGSGCAGPRLFADKMPDGPGGSGGAGGTGGEGGRAGHGGIASNIYVTAPEAARGGISCVALPSQPGSPGHGGRGGAAGTPGISAGDAGPPAAAPDGLPGASGPKGRARPAARVFLNEAAVLVPDFP